jgi:uncharacterized FlaG/YvyC family protein
MNISSSNPLGPTIPSAAPVPAAELAQRRELVQAANSVNLSGILGQNQLVFMIDRATHRVVIRVVDRNTHEILLQLPPEYIMRLAKDLGAAGTHTIEPIADM